MKEAVWTSNLSFNLSPDNKTIPTTVV